jgi:hypothetical protein
MTESIPPSESKLISVPFAETEEPNRAMVETEEGWTTVRAFSKCSSATEAVDDEEVTFITS